MSLSIWNLVIVGIIAVVAVYAYNAFVAGKVVAGFHFGRA